MLRLNQIIVVITTLLFMPLAHAHRVEYVDTVADYDTRYPVYDDSIERRLDRQQHRIDTGIRQGSLTAAEVRKLRHAQKRIARLERRLGYDGNLCERDLKRLHRRLDRISEKIYRLKHNRHVSRRYHHAHIDRWNGDSHAGWERVTRIEYEQIGPRQSDYY